MTDDESNEWKLRAAAVPSMLVIALLFHSWDTGHAMQRMALSMPLHELGHAVSGWWCGFSTVPTLWKTLIPESRGVFAPLVVAAFNAFLIYRGWVTQRMWLAAVGVALGALQFLGTATIAPATAHMLITFGGDAGAMVLGTLLMCTFFVGPESRLRNGGLRWGLLAIGAAGYVDTFATWWAARKDRDAIPFGEIEGVGLSDASKLDEVHRWTDAQIVDRYVAVGTICLVALIAMWAWAVWSARRDR